MKTPLMVLAALALGAGCLDPGEPGNLVPRTVTEDPTLPQIQVNGTHLRRLMRRTASRRPDAGPRAGRDGAVCQRARR